MIDNIVLRAGQTLTYTYQLTYQDDIPLQTISLEDIKGSNYGTGYRNIIADGLLDIKLQPVDGCVRYLETFINEGTRSTQTPKKRTYTNTGINLQQILDDYSNNVDQESQKNADEQIKKLTTTPGSTIPTIPGLTDTVNFTDLLSSAFTSAFNGGLNLNVDIL
ncbi:MAG: hypothetical protein LBG59_02635 [Candidatus Peribacteria bacterium]|nr:hypothetical protein [Candidatus Peribacteria bacterium]